MERYLRFYIKFQGYIIAIMCLLASVFITAIIFFNTRFHYPLDEFYNFRLMGSAALVFGVLWFIAGVSMLYGIIRETKTCLYPFTALFMFDLFLLFCRDIVQIWRNQRWHEIVLLNPLPGFFILLVTMHVIMTLLALGKLFEHEPLAPSGTNFVRFKTEKPRTGSSPVVYDADEVALVTE